MDGWNNQVASRTTQTPPTPLRDDCAHSAKFPRTIREPSSNPIQQHWTRSLQLSFRPINISENHPSWLACSAFRKIRYPIPKWAESTVAPLAGTPITRKPLISVSAKRLARDPAAGWSVFCVCAPHKFICVTRPWITSSRTAAGRTINVVKDILEDAAEKIDNTDISIDTYQENLNALLKNPININKATGTVFDQAY